MCVFELPNPLTSSKSEGTNKMEIRLTKNFEEITYCKRGDEFNAYHRRPS